MTTLLEARYRAVLRLLPAYYREAREDEMVETYLWDVDPDTQEQSRPTLAEVASIAALAVRTRLGAPGAPRVYARLGAAVRVFALYAVLLQAASAVVDWALALTWASNRAEGEGTAPILFGFTGHGPAQGALAVAQWTLPLLWTVGYFALVHDRRRLARAAVLPAALPTLWPFLGPLVGDSVPADPGYAVIAALFAWLPALALCAAHHRDAPAATVPGGSPGLVFLASCVVMGASIVLGPDAADAAWAPATCFAVGALAWLVLRVRRGLPGDPGEAFALAALGLLLCALRGAAVYPWLDVAPAALIDGALAQAAVLALLVTALAVIGVRESGRTVGEDAERATKG